MILLVQVFPLFSSLMLSLLYNLHTLLHSMNGPLQITLNTLSEWIAQNPLTVRDLFSEL